MFDLAHDTDISTFDSVKSLNFIKSRVQIQVFPMHAKAMGILRNTGFGHVRLFSALISGRFLVAHATITAYISKLYSILIHSIGIGKGGWRLEKGRFSVVGANRPQRGVVGLVAKFENMLYCVQND